MAADPRAGKNKQVKIGANGPKMTVPNNYVVASPSVDQMNVFTQQATQLEQTWNTAKTGAMDNAGVLKAEYANTAAEIQRQKLAELANTENAALARGMLGASATGEQYINLRGAAQTQVNAAANALRAGLAANQNSLQQARIGYDAGRDQLSVNMAGAQAGASTDYYSMGGYDPTSPTGGNAEGGGGGGPTNGGGNNAGANGAGSAAWRPFVRGNAKPTGGSPAHALLSTIMQQYPEVYRWVQSNMKKKWGTSPEAQNPRDATMQEARKMWKYIYRNQYGG